MDDLENIPVQPAEASTKDQEMRDSNDTPIPTIEDDASEFRNQAAVKDEPASEGADGAEGAEEPVAADVKDESDNGVIVWPHPDEYVELSDDEDEQVAMKYDDIDIPRLLASSSATLDRSQQTLDSISKQLDQFAKEQPLLDQEHADMDEESKASDQKHTEVKRRFEEFMAARAAKKVAAEAAGGILSGANVASGAAESTTADNPPPQGSGSLPTTEEATHGGVSAPDFGSSHTERALTPVRYPKRVSSLNSEFSKEHKSKLPKTRSLADSILPDAESSHDSRSMELSGSSLRAPSRTSGYYQAMAGIDEEIPPLTEHQHPTLTPPASMGAPSSLPDRTVRESRSFLSVSALTRPTAGSEGDRAVHESRSRRSLLSPGRRLSESGSVRRGLSQRLKNMFSRPDLNATQENIERPDTAISDDFGEDDTSEAHIMPRPGSSQSTRSLEIVAVYVYEEESYILIDNITLDEDTRAAILNVVSKIRNGRRLPGFVSQCHKDSIDPLHKTECLTCRFLNFSTGDCRASTIDDYACGICVERANYPCCRLIGENDEYALVFLPLPPAVRGDNTQAQKGYWVAPKTKKTGSRKAKAKQAFEPVTRILTRSRGEAQ